MSAEKTTLTREEQRQVVRNAFEEFELEFFRQFGAKMTYFNDGDQEFRSGDDVEDEA